MRNTEIKTIKTIYRPALVNGRWHTMNCNTGKMDDILTFTDKSLSEMICANHMKLHVDEARVLWDLMDKQAV